MIKARTPDQSVITYSGRRYTISDAFPTPKMAEHAAEDIRGTVDRGHIVGKRCRAVKVCSVHKTGGESVIPQSTKHKPKKKVQKLRGKKMMKGRR